LCVYWCFYGVGVMGLDKSKYIARFMAHIFNTEEKYIRVASQNWVNFGSIYDVSVFSHEFRRLLYMTFQFDAGVMLLEECLKEDFGNGQIQICLDQMYIDSPVFRCFYKVTEIARSKNRIIIDLTNRVSGRTEFQGLCLERDKKDLDLWHIRSGNSKPFRYLKGEDVESINEKKLSVAYVNHQHEPTATSDGSVKIPRGLNKTGTNLYISQVVEQTENSVTAICVRFLIDGQGVTKKAIRFFFDLGGSKTKEEVDIPGWADSVTSHYDFVKNPRNTSVHFGLSDEPIYDGKNFFVDSKDRYYIKSEELGWVCVPEEWVRFNSQRISAKIAQEYAEFQLMGKLMQ